ncbi:Uncharacterized protein PBTT_08218 [Plasmodiophora brassicae]
MDPDDNIRSLVRTCCRLPAQAPQRHEYGFQLAIPKAGHEDTSTTLQVHRWTVVKRPPDPGNRDDLDIRSLRGHRYWRVAEQCHPANGSDIILHHWSVWLGGFTCDVLSAVSWTKIIKEVPGCGHDSWFGRFLDRNRLAKLALCTLPVAFDTAACLCNALYVNIPYMYQFIATLVMVMQLAVGIQFLLQGLKFQKIVGKTVEQVRSSSTSGDMKELLRRLSRWTLCLSLAMIAFVGFLPIGITTFVYTRVGWVLFWGGGGTARALTSLFRVLLAQPPPARKHAPTAIPLQAVGAMRSN